MTEQNAKISGLDELAGVIRRTFTEQHTPGPWKAVKLELASKVFWKAMCRDGNLPETEANARLIAAAPELLAALERILIAHDTDNCGVVNGEAILSHSFASQARAAIAKARRDQP